MGTYNQGILGGFTGKVGPVVGTQWRGKQILRTTPSKTNKAPSAAQQRQRDKFAFVLQFLNPIKALLSETFGGYQGTTSPYNKAMSYHLTEAVTYTNTGFSMTYPKVLISMGELAGISNPTVNANTNTLTLQWTDNSTQAMAYPDDGLLVVIYAPNLQIFEYYVEPAVRTSGECHLSLPEPFIGQPLELWVSFTNTRKALSATSSYLGSVQT